MLLLKTMFLLALKPLKCDMTERLPKDGDIVLFVFLDSGNGKKEKSWMLGRVVQTNPTKVDIEY